MKKIYIFLLFCISLFVTGCGEIDEITKNKDSSQTEGIDSQDNQEEVKYKNNSENENKENEDYETYAGYWTVGGIDHETIRQDGGTEFRVSITNGNELNGYLFSQQWMSQRIAEIDNITGIIKNNECYFDFDEDGWGGTGTLHIQFVGNKINIEVLNYKMDDDNSSGFGISGEYQFERAEDDTSL